MTTPAGQVLVPGGATGDLFRVVGRPAAHLPGYGYSAGLMALNASGHVCEEASHTAFIVNPNAFLTYRLGPGHTSKMPFGRRDGARYIAAWLAQVR